MHQREKSEVNVTVVIPPVIAQPASSSQANQDSTTTNSYVAVALLAAVLLLQLTIIFVFILKNYRRTRFRSQKERDEENSSLLSDNSKCDEYKTLAPRHAFDYCDNASSSASVRSSAHLDTAASEVNVHSSAHLDSEVNVRSSAHRNTAASEANKKPFSFTSPSPPLQVQDFDRLRDTSSVAASLKTQSKSSSFHVHGDDSGILADLEVMASNADTFRYDATTSTPLKNGVIAVTRTFGDHNDPGVANFYHYQARSLWQRREDGEVVNAIDLAPATVADESDKISLDS